MRFMDGANFAARGIGCKNRSARWTWVGTVRKLLRLSRTQVAMSFNDQLSRMIDHKILS
jgi:hypothetical protein